MPFVGKLIYPKSAKNAVKEVNFFTGHPVYWWVKMVERDGRHEGVDNTVEDEIGVSESNHTKYMEKIETAILVKQKYEENQLPILLLFMVFIFIIILMFLSEWIDPLEVLRSSKHQMVIIEEWGVRSEE